MLIQDPITQGPDPDPDPEHQRRCSPPLGALTAAAAEDRVPDRRTRRSSRADAGGRCSGWRAAERRPTPSPATGTLDVLRYGRVAARRGSWSACAAPGSAFDGLYYVKSVTHNIKRGEYKQSFTLTRNGLRLDRSRRCRHERGGDAAASTTASTAAR